MASAARGLTRGVLRAAPRAPFTTTNPTAVVHRPSRLAVPRQLFRQHQSRRGYASEAPKSSSGGSNAGLIGGIAVLALAGGGGYWFYTQNPDVFAGGAGAAASGASSAAKKAVGAAASSSSSSSSAPRFEDYQKVYDAVAKALEEHDEYDDGSYGPVLLRLGWHASGTFDKETGTGGSNGATMRFPPEGDHGANAGLHAARDFLEPIKKQFAWITYSDLWTLAAVCAIQEMQGPVIPWRPGRADRDVAYCTPDGRLPDASKEQKHLRAIFGRMGFNDQEIVALSGAHALGRCHTDRSGFEGPWTFSPTVLTNDYYKLLLDEKWQWRKWNGPKQFEDVSTKTLMMLPTDMALIQDKGFRAYVEKYANDNEAFFKDFSEVLMKLFELGVPFTMGEDARFRFRPHALD